MEDHVEIFYEGSLLIGKDTRIISKCRNVSVQRYQSMTSKDQRLSLKYAIYQMKAQLKSFLMSIIATLQRVRYSGHNRLKISGNEIFLEF